MKWETCQRLQVLTVLKRRNIYNKSMQASDAIEFVHYLYNLPLCTSKRNEPKNKEVRNDLLLFYWREYRLKVAMAATVLIFGTSLLLSLLNSEPFDLLAASLALIQSLMNLGLYVIMTPVFVIGYYLYQKQQHNKNLPYSA